MNEILVSYIEDLRDSLLLFNESMMSIQNGERDANTVNNIFRVAHTIKGNSAAMSFLKIQEVMHTMEDLLSEVRNGTRELTDDLVNVLFACHDFLEDCLEVVQAQASDEGMDTEKLLSRLVALKGGTVETAPEVQTVSTAEKTQATAVVPDVVPEQIEHMDLNIGMPVELWEVLNENSKSGLVTYHLTIRFMKNSSMKAVRAWMMFDRIDQSGILIYSNPPRLNDSNLGASGETPFETDIIDVVFMCEHEINELVEDLKSTPDIESVSAVKLLEDDIAKRCMFMKRQKGVTHHLQEIGLELLGIDIQFIQESNITNMISKLSAVVVSNIAPAENPAIISAKRLILSLEQAKQNSKKISIAERENIVFICQAIEECILSPALTKDSNFVSVMYRKLDDLIEVVSTPEQRIGDILTSQGLIQSTDVEAIAQRSKDEGLKFGQAAVKEKLVSAYDVVTALKDKAESKPSGTDSAATGIKAAATAIQSTLGEGGFVRVPVTKVDSLIDMLSELLIYNSQLEQSAELLEMEDSKTANILSRTEKLIKEIQALSMSLRMIEVKQTFHRLTRIARDAATDLGKKITVNLEGEDTEIDRSAVEKLFDPLMHMVRNAVSHGIEDTEEDRLAAGKKPEGQITIAGYSKQGNVYIEIKDDGRGINTKKVSEKARKLGLINENKEYTDQEIFKFIFLPGFSTQENVNTISGRGVGMNIVEEAVNNLGGKIEIDSELGMGSSFRVKLPINLAVVNGTIVEIAGIRYIIPTICVRKFFIAKSTDWVSLQGENRAIKLDDGSIISLISKEKIFGIEDDIIHNLSFFAKSNTGTEEMDKEYEMVLLEIDQKLLILHVDKIIGRQDVVSKPLATDYASVPYANSASILGDGIVSLILDIDAIFKMSQTMY